MKESLLKLNPSIESPKNEFFNQDEPVTNMIQEKTFSYIPATNPRGENCQLENIDTIREDLGISDCKKITSFQDNNKDNLFQTVSEHVISPENKIYNNLSEIFLDSIEVDEKIISQIVKIPISKNEFLYKLKAIYENDEYDFSVHATKKSLWLDYLSRNGTLQPTKKDHISVEFMKLMSTYLQQMLLYCAQQQPGINLVQFAAFKGDKQYDSLTRPRYAERRAEKRIALFIRLFNEALGKNKIHIVFEKDLFQRIHNAIIYDVYLKNDNKYKQNINKIKNLFNSFLHI